MATMTLFPPTTGMQPTVDPASPVKPDTATTDKLTAPAQYNTQIDKSLYEPELHIIGELVSATGIATPNCFAYYRVVTGTDWTCVGGTTTGQTHVDYPVTSIIQSMLHTLTHTQYTHTFTFNHPIDLHYYTQSIRDWPRLVIELYTLDNDSNHHVVGYGFCYIPCQNGTHDLTVHCFRPVGTLREELINMFTPNVPSLISTECVYSVVKAKDDRPLLSSESVGTVQVRMDVMLRNMNAGVQT